MNIMIDASIIRSTALLLGLGLLIAYSDQAEIQNPRIRVPPGFTIDIFSSQVPGARSMTLADDGTVYVGTTREGKVYALRDENDDGKAEWVRVLASGLNQPNGVAWLSGDLYVGEISRILRFKEGQSMSDVVYAGFPTDTHHGWKYLRAGPDGKLYSGVGVPCNSCRPTHEIYGSLVRLNPDGSNVEIIARGVRNSVGFDWHPQTGELWFTDNGRDWLGDDSPPDELNRLATPGQSFGFPYCFGRDIADPDFGKLKSCKETTAPEWAFPAHVAALGAHFYTGTQFPEAYRNQLFVAQHGSWNRSQPQGYRVVVIHFVDGKPTSEQVFAEGWLQPDGKVSGRPVDVLPLQDGSLLVSDELAGALYRISYAPQKNH